jgi:hypothetical protein
MIKKKWSGIITNRRFNNTGADFGFGVAVLAKIGQIFGGMYKPQVYSTALIGIIYGVASTLTSLEILAAVAFSLTFPLC